MRRKVRTRNRKGRKHKPLRVSGAIGVGVLAGVASGLVNAGSAVAGGNAVCSVTGGVKVSQACYVNLHQLVYGAIADQPDSVLNLTDYTVDLGMWHWVLAYGDGCNPNSNYASIGYIRNFYGSNPDYFFFITSVQNGHFDSFTIGTQMTSADGQLHAYEVKADNGNQWHVYLDGTLKHTWTGGIGSSLCVSTAGLVATTQDFNNSHTNAATFESSPLKWLDGNGTWHQGWDTSLWWLDNPCGAGYSPPNCLNGTYTSGGTNSNDWSANKPAS